MTHLKVHGAVVTEQELGRLRRKYSNRIARHNRELSSAAMKKQLASHFKDHLDATALLDSVGLNDTAALMALKSGLETAKEHVQALLVLLYTASPMMDDGGGHCRDAQQQHTQQLQEAAARIFAQPLMQAAKALATALVANDSARTQAALDSVEAELLYLDASASFLLQSATLALTPTLARSTTGTPSYNAFATPPAGFSVPVNPFAGLSAMGERSHATPPAMSSMVADWAGRD
jgi:hypothetical protein